MTTSADVAGIVCVHLAMCCFLPKIASSSVRCFRMLGCNEGNSLLEGRLLEQAAQSTWDHLQPPIKPFRACIHFTFGLYSCWSGILQSGRGERCLSKIHLIIVKITALMWNVSMSGWLCSFYVSFTEGVVTGSFLSRWLTLVSFVQDAVWLRREETKGEFGSSASCHLLSSRKRRPEWARCECFLFLKGVCELFVLVSSILFCNLWVKSWTCSLLSVRGTAGYVFCACTK